LFPLLRFYEKSRISIHNHYRIAASILKLQRSNGYQIIKLISRDNNHFLNCNLKSHDFKKKKRKVTSRRNGKWGN